MITGPLPLRVRFKPGETALSVALRLSCRMSMKYSSFVRQMSFPISPFRISDEIGRLAEISGVPADDMLAATPIWQSFNTGTFMGHELSFGRYGRLFRRVCPDCLREDVSGRAPGEPERVAAYLRGSWLFIFVFGCERHGVELLSRCPSCGDRSGLENLPVDTCRCGFCFRNAVARRLTDAEREALSIVMARFRHETVAAEPTALRDIPLNEFVECLRFLGVTALHGRNREKVSSGLGDDIGPALTAGLSTVADLPGSFVGFLDGTALEPTGTQGSVSIYGLPLRGWIARRRPFIDRLRPIFERHLAERSLKRFFPDRSGPLPKQSRHLDARRARLTSGEWCRLRGVQGGWDGDVAPRRCDVLAATAPAGVILKLSAAARRLGISVEDMNRLVARGMFTVCWSMPSTYPKYFYTEDVDRWIEKLMGLAPRFASVPPTLMEVSTTRQAGFKPVVQHLLAIEEGRLIPAGVLVRRSGAGSILIDRRDALKRQFIAPSDALRVGALASALRVSPATLAGLRRDRLLADRSAGQSKYALPEDVAAFRALYVSQAELAELSSVPEWRLRRIATEAGVESVTAAPTTRVYAWSDVLTRMGLARLA